MANVDINGIARGSCTECECSEFLAGERVRCATCGHVPNKHSIIAADTAQKKPNSAPIDIQDNFQSLTNATFDLINTDSSVNSNPFHSNQTDFPSVSSPKLVQLDTECLPPRSGDSINVDARGVWRGPCSQCDCGMYQRPIVGVKCSSCAHPPIKHSMEPVPSQPQFLPLIEPLDLLNKFESPHSKVSAKVNISPVSLQSTASPSHRVMTSFRSDPPDVISVSADNSLIVPADHAVKITIEINVVPTSK